MHADDPEDLVLLETDRPIWDRVFSVAPLVIVGSKEADGRFNLAPKHLAMPLGGLIAAASGFWFSIALHLRNPL